MNVELRLNITKRFQKLEILPWPWPNQNKTWSATMMSNAGKLQIKGQEYGSCMQYSWLVTKD